MWSVQIARMKKEFKIEREQLLEQLTHSQELVEKLRAELAALRATTKVCVYGHEYEVPREQCCY